MSHSWDLSQFGSNDNNTNPKKDWHDKVRDLGNYRAPMRHAELFCHGCGWFDYYLFYKKSGTDNLKCRKCQNNNCLDEK